jgi:hypothetical protein
MTHTATHTVEIFNDTVRAGRDWITSIAEGIKADPPADGSMDSLLAVLRNEWRELPESLENKTDEVLLDLADNFRTAAGKNRLESAPAPAPAPARKSGELEAGMYRKDGKIYKVQVAVHGSRKPYAKELVFVEHHDMGDSGLKGVWEFVYAKGMVYKLTSADRMTLEDAKEFGALYGTCCVCGRLLTNEVSIEAGIGPVCGKRV